MSAIVKVDSRHYRVIAQEHWDLTDEQMKGMHVHHRIPQSEGGSDDPSNLFVCSPWFHAHVWHGRDSFYPMIQWCAENGKKGGKVAQEIHKQKEKHPLSAWWEEQPKTVQLERASNGGKKGGAISGKILKAENKGIFGRSQEQHAEDSRMGVKTQQQNKVGIFDPDNEAVKEGRRKGAAKAFGKKVKCPHCGKEGATGPMHRFHFDRCKHRVH